MNLNILLKSIPNGTLCKFYKNNNSPIIDILSVARHAFALRIAVPSLLLCEHTFSNKNIIFFKNLYHST